MGFRGLLMLFGWLLCGAWPCAAGAAVFKCDGADGVAVYQQTPCNGSIGDGRHDVQVPPPSDPLVAERAAKQPAWPTPRPARERAMREHRRRVADDTLQQATALRCTSADGRVSYVYSGRCPAGRERWVTVPGRDRLGRPVMQQHRVRETVEAERISLSAACREIRSGRGRSNVSTYDRNLGRDPCS